MKKSTAVILFAVFCLLTICYETTHAAVLPDDRVDDFDGYGGDDIENTIRDLLSGEVDKRGFRCRPGYTYQSILRDCVPSLGALRGRGGRRKG